jgi:protein-S-isoprenylcysteine O-methyltransferase Ste14
LSIQYILIGLLGFVSLAGADWATYKEIRYLKPILWFGIFSLSIYAIIMAWIDTGHFNFPGILSTLAWIPLILFFILFNLSLFVEIPARETYLRREQPKRVISTGTYALTRHPAFLWFIIWIISAVFASRSVTLAVATPVWIIAYILCLFLEDKLTSIGRFAAEYHEYQKETPMLFPTYRSARRFAWYIKSLFTRTSETMTKDE